MTSIDFLQELFRESKFEEIISTVEKLDSKLKNLQIETMKIRSIRKLGKYKEAIEAIGDIEIKSTDSVISQITYYSIELDVLTHMGKYDEGKKRTQNLILLLDKINISELSSDDKLIVAEAYNELARLNFFTSEFDKALENLEKQLVIAREIDNKEKITTSLQNIGSTHVTLGNYVESIDYLTQALDIAKELNVNHLIGHIEDNLGLVYYYQGKLDDALELLNSSLDIHTQVKDPRGMGFNYEYIGLVKLKQDNISEALDNFEKSYELRKKLGNDNHTASIVLPLVTTYLELQNREKSFEYLSELKEILSRTKTKRIQMLTNLAEAIYLKDSKIFRNVAKAEILFKEVIEEPDITEFAYTIAAYLHLIEILYDQIRQLEISGPDALVEEVNLLFDEIEECAHAIGDISERKNLPDLKVGYFNIMGFIAISKFNVEPAFALFNQAEEICRQYDLDNMKFQFKEIEHQNKTDAEQSLVMNKQAFPHNIQKSLNKIIHSLPRLLIITSLLKNIQLTFTELTEMTKMSPGNLGKHCEKLIEIGYMHKEKEFINDRFLTVYSLTPEGLNEFNKYTDILIPFLSSAQTT